MQMEFVSRIIDLASDIIKIIKDVLKVTYKTIGIIKDHFKELIYAFLSNEWYNHLGYTL
jgi:hypothetical protein